MPATPPRMNPPRPAARMPQRGAALAAETLVTRRAVSEVGSGGHDQVPLETSRQDMAKTIEEWQRAAILTLS